MFRKRDVRDADGSMAPAARGAAHLGRMELLAASAKHAAAPDRRLGPPALRRRRHTRPAASRRPGEYAGTGEARPGGECSLTRGIIGHPLAAGPCTDLGA